MGTKARSAKGEIVDFDLLKIKQQIVTNPSARVAEREMQIDKKLKRKIKKVEAPAPKIKMPEKLADDAKSVKKQRARIIENNDTTEGTNTNEPQTDQQ